MPIPSPWQNAKMTIPEKVGISTLMIKVKDVIAIPEIKTTVALAISIQFNMPPRILPDELPTPATMATSVASIGVTPVSSARGHKVDDPGDVCKTNGNGDY